MRAFCTVAILGFFYGILSLAGVCHGLGRKGGPAGELLGDGYLAGAVSSLEKVSKQPGRFRGEVANTAAIDAAGNEYESYQIVLFSPAEPLLGVHVEPTDLFCRHQQRLLTRENITVRRVAYVETRRPVYDVEFVGYWPDPLMPLEPFDVPGGVVQPIWVTVYVPENTLPGIYRGAVLIHAENAAAETLHVALQVWDFALPKNSHLQVVFSLYQNVIEQYYGSGTLPADILRAYYSFLLTYRINPTNLYLSGHPQPRIEDYEYCIHRGMNAANVAYLHDRQGTDDAKGGFSREYREQIRSTLPGIASRLREKQWLDVAFVYGPDEPAAEQYPAIREIFTLVRESAPGLRRVLTREPTGELYGSVDVWVPRMNRYEEKTCRARQALGEEVWWYVCARPHHPYPNFFIDYPAIDHRIIFWLTWKYDISGVLYYSLNRWITNYSSGKGRWPEVPWNTHTWGEHNGDGQLIYPGPEGLPYSSIRLEVIRDGIEDYEYLHLLERLARELEWSRLEDAETYLRSADGLIERIQERVVSRPDDYLRTNDQLLDYRRMVAGQIVRLKTILEMSARN